MTINTGSAPGIVKVLIPAGLALATALGGASWSTSMSNEHRLTAVEHATDYTAKSVDTLRDRQAHIEEKFDHMLEGIGRIEGALAERNRAEPTLARTAKPQR